MTLQYADPYDPRGAPITPPQAPRRPTAPRTPTPTRPPSSVGEGETIPGQSNAEMESGSGGVTTADIRRYVTALSQAGFSGQQLIQRVAQQYFGGDVNALQRASQWMQARPAGQEEQTKVPGAARPQWESRAEGEGNAMPGPGQQPGRSQGTYFDDPEGSKGYRPGQYGPGTTEGVDPAAPGGPNQPPPGIPGGPPGGFGPPSGAAPYSGPRPGSHFYNQENADGSYGSSFWTDDDAMSASLIPEIRDEMSGSYGGRQGVLSGFLAGNPLAQGLNRYGQQALSRLGNLASANYLLSSPQSNFRDFLGGEGLGGFRDADWRGMLSGGTGSEEILNTLRADPSAARNVLERAYMQGSSPAVRLGMQRMFNQGIRAAEDQRPDLNLIDQFTRGNLGFLDF